MPAHLSAPRDLPPRPGVSLVPGGADFCVYAGHADAVEICLFETGDATGRTERRVPLTERAHGFWFGHIEGVATGQRYGIRAHGPWRPEQGLRYNPAKLLIDPYARGLDGEVRWRPEVYGHSVSGELRGDHTVRDDRDSAAYVPRSVVLDDTFDWEGDEPLRAPLSAGVIYELHVRNLTMRLPGVPEHLRGTYAGLAHPVTIEHLTSLGVTAVELLPVHAFASEPDVTRRGLTNHWGYSTLGFFAPQARYAATPDPQAALDEFKGMVKLLHRAGISVLLDVVYNHTAEQSVDGSTLSWRGLDNRAYYRLDDRGRDIDVTGCGNTIDVRHPVVCRMVLDSLRYWVNECHVDGFRFDLAVALGRGRSDDFEPDHPFLVALRTDPVLSEVVLIAEPWDLGIHGWRTGQFPPPFSEWNDRFRDSVRTFWLQDVARDAAGQSGHGVRELATRLAGSQDLFGSRDRGTVASVNFVAAHDGFTAADLTAYNGKHNGANGEGNRDGSDDNRSWNHGVEGAAAEASVAEARRRTLRNLVGTLLVATGVPMVNAGDEFGRSQRGNNNAYCQDNDISWFDWDHTGWQRDMLATTQFLTALRRDYPVLRQRTFFSGRPVHADGSTDLAWFDVDGHVMHNGRWEDGSTRTLQMLLNGAHQGRTSLLIVFHGAARAASLTLAQAPGLTAYELLWDSSWDTPRDAVEVVPGEPVLIGAASLQIYRVTDPT